MGKCLITKLNGIVNNDNIQKLGELRFQLLPVSSPTADTEGITLKFSKNTSVAISGNAYFTDSALSANNGKTVDFTGNNAQLIYVSNNDGYLSIPDKYDIMTLQASYSKTMLDLDLLKFSNKLGILVCKASGNISILGNLKNISTVQIKGDELYGDIKGLKDATNLETLEIASLNITGDISSLSKLNKCNRIILKGAVLTGDLSDLPTKCKYFESIDANYTNINHLSWSKERQSTSNIVALNEVWLDKDVDKMLINQAKCNVGFISSDQSWFKTITVHGTRTSASDEAIRILQGKGYTISVNP